MAEFHPLSPSPQSDYSISSSDRTSMDDVSLSSSRNGNKSLRRNNNVSSGASVSSKFSRASRKQMKNGDLAVPLTSSSLEERGENEGHNRAAGSTANKNNGTATIVKAKSFISEDDPFYIFRGDLVQKLMSVDEELSRYLGVVRDTDTAVNTQQVKETKKQLKRHIKHAEASLSDLETTVRVVERRRDKFPHINDAEIAERRKFVDDSKHRIVAGKGEMQSDEVKQKFVKDERALLERRKANKSAGATAPSSASNTANHSSIHSDLEKGNCAVTGDSTDPARSETLLMMQQQDETLEDLDMAVTRVGYMAETIHEEIDTQNVMLKSLEEDLADAEEQLGVVMGKLAKLLKTKSKCQIGLIVMLCLVVLILFFLVIYT